jgi:two-component system phosphate regulon sensor histidine kinase PhoR
VGLSQCEKEAKARSGVLAPQMHRIDFEGGQPCEIAGVQTEPYSEMSNLVTHAVRHISVSEKGLIRIPWDLLADG